MKKKTVGQPEQVGQSKIKVLLVEDHEATLKGLKAELNEEQDIEVAGTATTSSEALSLAQALNPDIILLDLHLPDSTGPKVSVKRFAASVKPR